MFFKNPNSHRENPFYSLYSSEKFRNVLKYRNDLPEFPPLVDVELTNFCNLNCLFCNQQVMTREKGFMRDDIFRKIVDECAEYGTPIRLIRFGEPFLHKKIIEYCRYAKDKGVKVHITNNGLIINEDHMRHIVELGVDSMIFSFQGATKDEYQKMRNNDKYDLLVSNIKRLVEIRGDSEKPFIQVSSTMTNESKEEVDAFVSYWSGIVDAVSVGKTNLSSFSMDQVKSFEKIGKIEYLRTQETIEKKYVPCVEVYQKLSVDYDGKVTGCCGDHDRLLQVGDVNKESLHEIWNSSKLLKSYRTLLDNMRHSSLSLCRTCYHTYEDF